MKYFFLTIFFSVCHVFANQIPISMGSLKYHFQFIKINFDSAEKMIEENYKKEKNNIEDKFKNNENEKKKNLEELGQKRKIQKKENQQQKIQREAVLKKLMNDELIIKYTAILCSGDKKTFESFEKLVKKYETKLNPIERRNIDIDFTILRAMTWKNPFSSDENFKKFNDDLLSLERIKFADRIKREDFLLDQLEKSMTYDKGNCSRKKNERWFAGWQENKSKLKNGNHDKNEINFIGKKYFPYLWERLSEFCSKNSLSEKKYELVYSSESCKLLY